MPRYVWNWSQPGRGFTLPPLCFNCETEPLKASLCFSVFCCTYLAPLVLNIIDILCNPISNKHNTTTAHSLDPTYCAMQTKTSSTRVIKVARRVGGDLASQRERNRLTRERLTMQTLDSKKQPGRLEKSNNKNEKYLAKLL